MRKAEAFLLFMALLSFATGAVFYAHVPALVASHWDAAGNVNGYLSRVWGIFLFPIILVVVFLLLYFIPRIDPKRENILHFIKYYDYFLIGFSIFFYYIYLLTLLWNIGYRFNFTTLLVPPIAGILYLAGMLLPYTKRNFSIGIRTPWTISSDTVWDKTHHAGGIVFKISAVIALLGTAFPDYALWFLLAPIIASAIGLTIYSYILYEKERGK